MSFLPPPPPDSTSQGSRPSSIMAPPDSGTPHPLSHSATSTSVGTASSSKPRRIKRLAATPLKPLKLAASAIQNARSGTSTPVPYEVDDGCAESDDNISKPVRQLTGASSASGHLDLPVEGREKERKRLSLRRGASSRSVNPPSIDPLLSAARGPRKPLEGEEPAATLRVRVVSGADLVAKDRNGFSDPFVTLQMAPSPKVTTPVIKKTVFPTWPAAQSTFDFPVYLSLAGVIGGRGLEGVVWDKDLMRKEYMGEFHAPVNEWFSDQRVGVWNEDLPVRVFELMSSRRRQKVTGTVSLQIGFVLPTEGSRDAAMNQITGVYDTLLHRWHLGGQLSVLGVPAHEGIGTVLVRSEGSTDSTASAQNYRVLASSTVPAPGQSGGNVLEQVDVLDVSDTGLSESEYEDAPDFDFDHELRESPSQLDQDPLDAALREKRPSYSHTLGVPGAEEGSQSESRKSSTGSMPPSGAATPGPQTSGGRRRKVFGRKRRHRQFNLDSSNNVKGIVVMEVIGANDLPRIKNAIRLGWDMDPFVVISFGKKVFRTRVIRHSLNPTWDEKLFFHVHEHESSYTIQFAVLDWDKISGNDAVGTCTLPLKDLIEAGLQPDDETGLYPESAEGKHDGQSFTLPIVTSKSQPWEAKHSPTLKVRVKYEPYGAIRQRFWRTYAKQYDADGNGTLSMIEIQAMLYALGSTLSLQTLEGYFTEFGLSADTDELSMEQLVICLEREVSKTYEQKRKAPLQRRQDGGIDASELSDELMRSWPGRNGGNGAEYSSDVTNGSSIPHHSASGLSLSSQHAVPTVVTPGAQSQFNYSSGAPGTPSPPSETEGEETPEECERVMNIKECPFCHRPRLGKRSEQDIVTHVAICASNDWSRLDRIITSTFVTSSQAQRKALTKLVNKVTIGRYSLGANSANILVQDRATGQFQEEKMAVYVRVGIRVLYKGAGSGMGSSRARKMLKSMSIKQGIRYDSPVSAADIGPFIAFHHLNVDEILDPLDSFKTFNEFFYRKLKPDARPLEEPDNDGRLVSAADCRLMCFSTVQDATQIWIKGRDFTIARLLGPQYKDMWDRYDGGALAIFRLAPQDYHRFHSPVTGRVGKITLIDGEYYTVNPQAIRTSLDVYGENVRQIVPIETKDFGTVMTVWVGAMMVGSIGTTVREGEMVQRGEELGWFAFGGSTIVCLIEKDRVVWDQDLIDNGKAAIETLVRVGTGIGRATT